VEKLRAKNDTKNCTRAILEGMTASVCMLSLMIRLWRQLVGTVYKAVFITDRLFRPFRRSDPRVINRCYLLFLFSPFWRRPWCRPRQTWLRTVKNDLKQQNLGLWSARHRAYDREQWRDIVETATLL